MYVEMYLSIYIYVYINMYIFPKMIHDLKRSISHLSMKNYLQTHESSFYFNRAQLYTILTPFQKRTFALYFHRSKAHLVAFHRERLSKVNSSLHILKREKGCSLNSSVKRFLSLFLWVKK